MIDALGEPQAVLVLGGTSEIALATVRRLGQLTATLEKVFFHSGLDG